jgi:hypothetical protein
MIEVTLLISALNHVEYTQKSHFCILLATCTYRNVSLITLRILFFH